MHPSFANHFFLQIVKLFVPYFKAGKIASKEVFKASAREFTHILIEASDTPVTEYSKIVESFFGASEILYSQEDAEKKISKFKKSFLMKSWIFNFSKILIISNCLNTSFTEWFLNTFYNFTRREKLVSTTARSWKIISSLARCRWSPGRGSQRSPWPGAWVGSWASENCDPELPPEGHGPARLRRNWIFDFLPSPELCGAQPELCKKWRSEKLDDDPIKLFSKSRRAQEVNSCSVKKEITLFYVNSTLSILFLIHWYNTKSSLTALMPICCIKNLNVFVDN